MLDRTVFTSDGTTTSFEVMCRDFERRFDCYRCDCCAGAEQHRCPTCVHCLGFHTCEHSAPPPDPLQRTLTLSLPVQRIPAPPRHRKWAN